MKNEMLHERQDFTDVRALVEWAADTYGEANAISYKPAPSKPEIITRSFIQLRDDVRALASELLTMGVAGRKVALIGKMSYEWALMYYATLSIGGILVPLDRDWQGEELCDTVDKAHARYLFCDEDIKEKADLICSKLTFKAPTCFLNAKKEENNVASLVENGRAKFAADPNAYFNAPIDPYTLALLVFTSGTTGKGKGVMLPQNAFLSDLSAVIPYIDFGKKTVSVLPPHHTFGSSVMLIGHMMIGCEMYFSAGLRYVVKELKEQKPEHLVLVPLYLETFYRRIKATLKEKGKEKLVDRMIKVSKTLPKLLAEPFRKKIFAEIRAAFGGEIKMIISGGAPINPEILDFFEAIGITTLNGYGITECAPIIAVNRSRNPVKGSVGNVLDICQVKIHDPNEDGEGEIWVTGPNVMLGYYKDEKATADAIDGDGYFKTGDYGKLTKDNILYITGRKKNLIILSNGKNVYPEEIENALVAVPGVIDIIVYEGQSRRGLEHNAIVAEVYPDKEFIEKNNITDIQAHLQAYVDDYNRTAVPYKKIGVLKVRTEEFPKNTLRKIMRFKLDMTID